MRPRESGPLPPTKVPAAPPAGPAADSPDAVPCVLVVEDEPLARVSIRATLQKAGFLVIEAESGEQALGLFDHGPAPDVVILDIGLPGLDGFEVCQAMRKKRTDVAILMLTARADPADKINGLTLGADDYLVKPFNPGELVARIRAVLRRSVHQAPSKEPLVHGELRLEPRSQKAFKRGWMPTCRLASSPCSRPSCGIPTRSCPGRSWPRRCGDRPTRAMPGRWMCSCASCATRSRTILTTPPTSGRPGAPATFPAEMLSEVGTAGPSGLMDHCCRIRV